VVILAYYIITTFDKSSLSRLYKQLVHMNESILFSKDTFAYKSRERLSALQKPPPPPFHKRYKGAAGSSVRSEQKKDTMKMVKTFFTLFSVCSLCLAFVSVHADDGDDSVWAVGNPLIHITRIEIDNK